jgi:putative membrane protein
MPPALHPGVRPRPIHPRAFSTATTHDPLASPAGRRLPLALAGAYAIVWGVTAVGPASRETWWLENLLPLSLVALLAGMYRRWHLSDVSCCCVALLLALHAVGAHYGYDAVPAGEWLREVFRGVGWGRRNPYDRVVHLAFGLLLAYPLREVLRHQLRRPALASPGAVAAVLALSGAYEVLEWAAARLAAPETAARFVGAQGDVWDAQQDVALAWGGSVVSVAAAALAHRARRARAHAGAGRAAPRAAA